MRIVRFGEKHLAAWRPIFMRKMTLVLGVAVACCSTAKAAPLQIRKNVSTLSAAERTKFVGAIKALKARTSGGGQKNYDDFVKIHRDEFDDAHNQASFLPWHRKFIRSIELEFQKIAGFENVTIPYWDWTVNQDKTAIPFTADFMGGDGDDTKGDEVQNGPFEGTANWKITVTPTGNAGNEALKRDIGDNGATLPSAANITTTLAKPDFEKFSEALEWGGGVTGAGMHNQAHNWVGGHLSTPAISVNDPLFSLNHAYVDLVWAKWQFSGTGRLSEYSGDKTDNLAGLGMTAGDVLDFTSLGYKYDIVPEPSTLSLAAFGLMGLAAYGWRSRKKGVA